MKSSRKIIIAIVICLGLLLFGVASSMSVAAHTGAMPHPTAVEY
jgi:uncharacterized membrane protein YczE